MYHFLYNYPMLPRVQIVGIASFLPPKKLTSLKLEEKIRAESPDVTLPNGIIELLTGVKERRVLDAKLNASDLAMEAGKKALRQAGLTIEDIDCLIFAAASGDISEPATANIVQQKLNATCPVFDVKNACNSFVNAIEIAESLIVSKKYKTILIVNGEAPSRVIRTKVHNQEQLRRAFAGYTLGDAGSAMILAPSIGKHGLLHTQLMSYGHHWEKSAVLGGGSRYIRDMDKYYFEGETEGLKDIFLEIGPQQIFDTLKKVEWKMEEVDKVIVHQVSLKSFDLLVKEAKIPREKLVIVLPTLGNMVASSIPVTLDYAVQNGEVHRGDKILLLGLAAGISIGTIALIW